MKSLKFYIVSALITILPFLAITGLVVAQPIGGGGPGPISGPSAVAGDGTISTGGADMCIESLSSDTAPTDGGLHGHNSWNQATGGNQTGGELVLSGGIGTKQITIDDWNNCAGDTVTVTMATGSGETSDVLTEGVDWTAATSNAATATSLASAIDALTGVAASASSGVVYLTPDTCGTYYLSLAEGDATCTTRTLGTDTRASVPSYLGLGLEGPGGDTYIRNGGNNTTQFYQAGSLILQLLTTRMALSDNIYILMGGSSYIYNADQSLCIGNTCAASGHSAATGDTQISGSVFEVDATATYFDGTTYFAQAVNLVTASGGIIYVGPNANSGFIIGTEISSGNKAPYISGGNQADYVIIGDNDTSAKNYDHGTYSGPPILYIHSDEDPDTDNTQWVGAQHNQTNPQFSSGKGDYEFHGDEGKGQYMQIATNTETLTFAANPGDASKDTSSLIPDGAFLIGITSRVTTTGTNCSSVSLGDTVDADLYGATTGITDGTTTTNADATATFANPLLAAGNVRVTANGGNCFDLVIAITAHYLAVSAATSN